MKKYVIFLCIYIYTYIYIYIKYIYVRVIAIYDISLYIINYICYIPNIKNL